MKIAIVRGGFTGVQQQLRRWRLERELETARRTLENTERHVRGIRTKIVNLERNIVDAPNHEVKLGEGRE